MSVVAFRPMNSMTIDFLLDALTVALEEREGKPIVLSRQKKMWKRTRVVWHYYGDGSIRFELAPAAEAAKGDQP